MRTWIKFVSGLSWNDPLRNKAFVTVVNARTAERCKRALAVSWLFIVAKTARPRPGNLGIGHVACPSEAKNVEQLTVWYDNATLDVLDVLVV